MWASGLSAHSLAANRPDQPRPKTTCASSRAAQSPRSRAGSPGRAGSSHEYQAQAIVATTMYRSPGTNCSVTSCCQRPRASTTSTPAIDSSTPATWARLTRRPKNSRPSASIHSGMLDATRVTFSGVEVRRARYCSAL
jgi:hypothetical protein